MTKDLRYSAPSGSGQLDTRTGGFKGAAGLVLDNNIIAEVLKKRHIKVKFLNQSDMQLTSIKYPLGHGIEEMLLAAAESNRLAASVDDQQPLKHNHLLLFSLENTGDDRGSSDIESVVSQYLEGSAQIDSASSVADMNFSDGIVDSEQIAVSDFYQQIDHILEVAMEKLDTPENHLAYIREAILGAAGNVE